MGSAKASLWKTDIPTMLAPQPPKNQMQHPNNKSEIRPHSVCIVFLSISSKEIIDSIFSDIMESYEGRPSIHFAHTLHIVGDPLALRVSLEYLRHVITSLYMNLTNLTTNKALT